MTHHEFEDRVEAVFAASAGERRPLHAALASLTAADPELAERWEDLEPALDALAGARLEAVPDELHAVLIQAARNGAARAGRPAPPGWASFFTAALQVRPAYALGGAVAAGIAIGAIGLALIFGATGRGPGSANDLAPGTAASLPPVTGSSALTTLDRGGEHAELITRRTDAGFVVRVEAKGDAAALTLSWDAAALRLTGVRWDGPQSPAFELSAGRARLPVAGASGCELSWSEIAPGGSGVRVTLSAAGDEQGETLRLPR